MPTEMRLRDQLIFIIVVGSLAVYFGCPNSTIVRSIKRARAAQAPNGNLFTALAPFAATVTPSEAGAWRFPYVRGRMALMTPDGVTHPLHWKLPDSLRASQVAEVGTLITIEDSESDISGKYSTDAGSFRSTRLVRLIDIAKEDRECEGRVSRIQPSQHSSAGITRHRRAAG